MLTGPMLCKQLNNAIITQFASFSLHSFEANPSNFFSYQAIVLQSYISVSTTSSHAIHTLMCFRTRPNLLQPNVLVGATCQFWCHKQMCATPSNMFYGVSSSLAPAGRVCKQYTVVRILGGNVVLYIGFQGRGCTFDPWIIFR